MTLFLRRVSTGLLSQVNNAGAHAPGSTVGGDMAVIDRSYQVNLRSVLIVTKRALPHILKNKDKGMLNHYPANTLRNNDRYYVRATSF